MQQKVTVNKWFPNMSSKIEICAVYQKDNALIAVSKILPSGHMGEATCTRKDTKTVETNVDFELPVKSIFLNRGQSLASVLEVSGLEALPFILSDDLEEDVSQKFTM